MARTRFKKSAAGISGVTFATIPSGVTIDANAINNVSTTEFDKLNGITAYGYPVGYASASGCSVSGGSSAWAGTTLSVNHGMGTDLKGFSVCQYNPSGVSVNQIQISYPSPVPGSVSVALVAMNQLGGASTATSGGTIYWVAFGN